MCVAISTKHNGHIPLKTACYLWEHGVEMVVIQSSAEWISMCATAVNISIDSKHLNERLT